MSTTIMNEVSNLLNKMQGITLSEMDHVKLMRRRDTKYVIPAITLPSILNDIKNQYRILEIEEKRMHSYQTLYYDTPMFTMYQAHHNHRLNRYKIRVRKYLTSDDTFLEVKFKNNKGETQKKRIEQSLKKSISDATSIAFLDKNSPYSRHEIEPALENSFHRITLVNKVKPERVTIDLGLMFSNLNGENSMEVPNLSVIEIKRDLEAGNSEIINVLNQRRLKAQGFSKYCMGTALVNKTVRTNLFKEKMRRIGKFEKNMVVNF